MKRVLATVMRNAVLAIFVAACGTNPPSSTTTSEVACPPDSTLTYDNFGKVLIADNCLECHAGKDSPRLDSQDAIQKNAQAIISAAVTSSKMPKSGDMVSDERQMLGEWLACGAP